MAKLSSFITGDGSAPHAGPSQATGEDEPGKNDSADADSSQQETES
jgi:hypothetical protein